jgi:hypothetical protein
MRARARRCILPPRNHKADAHACTRQLLRKHLTERLTVASSTTPSVESSAARGDERRGGNGSAYSNKKKRRRDEKERVSRGFSDLGGVQEHHPDGGDAPTAAVAALTNDPDHCLTSIHRDRPPDLDDPRHGVPEAPLLPPAGAAFDAPSPTSAWALSRCRSDPSLSRSLSSSFPPFLPQRLSPTRASTTRRHRRLLHPLYNRAGPLRPPAPRASSPTATTTPRPRPRPRTRQRHSWIRW